MQIVIHGKCKIRLATSKVKDRNLPILWKFRKNVLNEFQKSVDLAELVESGMHHFSFLRHHAKICEKWHCCSLFQHILLLAVMGHAHHLHRFLAHFLLNCYFSFLADKYGVRRCSGVHLHLTHLLHEPKHFFCCRLRFQILVKCLITTENL